MKKNPASPAEASSVVAKDNPDIEFDNHLVPYMAVLELQQKNMLNAGFARKALQVALIASAVSLLQLPVNAWLACPRSPAPVR